MSEDKLKKYHHFKIKTSDEIELDLIETKYYEELLDLYQKEKEKNKNLIKQLQEQNTEIQDISKQLREKEQEDIKMRAKFVLSLDEYILKDKIKEKIESIENTLEVCDEEINYRLKIEDKAKKEALTDLLEEE